MGCTGMITAVRGSEKQGGVFTVEDRVLAGLYPQPTPTLDKSLLNGEDRYVVLVSDLGIGGKGTNMTSLQLLVDMICGRLGSTQDQEEFSKISRLILAGNSLSEETSGRGDDKIAKYLLRNVQAKSVAGMSQLDQLVFQAGSCVPVDIMPGENDPASQFHPQQPLHKCMFPRSMSYSTVQAVSNPYEALVGGVRLLGTSGENVNNIFQYSGFEDRMDVLQMTLECGHVAPTCPDTLCGYPYEKKDPFIIQNCPQVYFAGSQPEFNSRTITGIDGQRVLLLSVPSFKDSHTAVLLNLRDLSCKPFIFDASFEIDEDMFSPEA